MTKAEWVLWITSTVFQGVIAWQVIWENVQLRKLAKKNVAVLSRANAAPLKPVDAEVVN